MRKRSNTTRPFTIALTESGYRRLKLLADDERLDIGDILSFVFENFDDILNEERFNERMRFYKLDLQA